MQVKFKTKKARELSLKLITKIKKHLTLQDSVKLLERFLPTIDVNEILTRQEWLKQSFAQIETISDIQDVQDQITIASSFNKDVSKRHNNIVIAFGSEDDYDKYRSELASKFFVTLVQTEHDALSISHYEEIRYVPSDQDLLAASIEELEQATMYSDISSVYDVAPELFTDIIEENAESLQALKNISSLLGESISIPDFSSEQVSFSSVTKEIELVVSSLQALISEEISASQFSGSQLVSIIQNNENILDKLPKSSRDKIIDFKNSRIKLVQEQFSLSIHHVITIDHVGKVLLDEEELEKLQQSFLALLQQDKSEFKQSIAAQSKDLLDRIDVILYKVLELDLKIAFSLFTSEFDLEFPVISGHGQSFVYGRNMNIVNAVPVEYYIGNTLIHSSSKASDSERVAIITGANSGGKTTLLELMGQVQMLAQMGFGVPAKQARVGIVEEFYYFSKSKGSANAGAFETLLKQFASVSDSSSSKLILADEIESVTEPDVAAKIIKGIVHHTQKQESNILVLVTHMGKELSQLDVNARFDGIEAKGLDADFNLVVDRNPIIGRIAKSTPQLIIERMSKKDEGNEFFSFLHSLVSS